MPIQCSIAQPSGVVATYHVVTSIPDDFLGAKATCYVNSYLDQAHYASAPASPIVSSSNDISAVLTQVPPTPAEGATVQQIITSIAEQYLLTVAPFTGGTQVS